MSMFNPTSLQIYENKVYYAVLFTKNPYTYHKISNKPLNLNYTKDCGTNGDYDDIFKLFQINSDDFSFNVKTINETTEETPLQYEFIVFSAQYNTNNENNLEEQHKLMRIMSPLIDNPQDSQFIHDYLHESNDIDIIIKKEFNIIDLLVNLEDNCTTLASYDGYCTYNRIDSSRLNTNTLRFNMYPMSTNPCKSYYISLPYLSIEISG
jgi:hypothetical protein